MNTLLKTIIISSLLVPVAAFAATATTSTATSTQATSTQIVASPLCLKQSTTAREDAISQARDVYNAAVKKAQDDRKKGLESASTTDAKKIVKDTYVTAIKKAQDARVTTRDNALAKWKTDTLACKNTRKGHVEKTKNEIKDMRGEKHEEIKSINEDAKKKLEGVTDKNIRKEINTERKEDIKDVRQETKSKTSELRDKIKSFFGR